MATPGYKPLTFRAKGLSDAQDASNAFPGAMQTLQNLIPSLQTPGMWIPRPATIGIVGSEGAPTLWGSFTWGDAPWGGFGNITGAAQINALLVVGPIVYGMVAATSGPYSGYDVPFAYNLLTQAFYTIAIPGGAASLPTTPATTGDWTPPIMAVVGSRIMITHPGFSGGSDPYFGWLDITSFTDGAETGKTNTSKAITNLSTNVLQAGWQVGDTILSSAGDIPADTTIVAIAADGLSLTLSQAATANNAGVTLTVAGGTPAAPLYGSGNTNGFGLIAVPVSVAQFNARAYFAVENGVQFSDAGSPCQITNADQALTFNNGLPCTALGALPLNSSYLGGIVQAIVAFQGDAQMQQITGDPNTPGGSNLALNQLGVGVGTLAPNTICATPQGLSFVAPDGLRIINFLALVSEPIGVDGQGVNLPFVNAQYPSRMCAAYNQDVMHISVTNAAVSGAPTQNYWFHLSRKVWSGPHTFPASLIQPNQSAQQGFVMVAWGIEATLWQASVTANTASIYVENGNAMQWSWEPCLLPDNDQMAENAVVESTLALVLPPSQQVTVTPVNESGMQLDQLSLVGPVSAGAVWGTFSWGAANWSASNNFLAQYDLPWHQPLVFKQMSAIINGFSTAGLGIGNLRFAFQPLGYRMQAMGMVSGGLR